jgi:hypothetical protein
MEIPEKIKTVAKNLGSICVNAYNNYLTALNDYTRMCEAENQILSISSAAFCRCFNDVARQICSARTNETADTYCELAEKAVELLASGKGEAETLYYFDEILTREKKLRGSRE